MTLIQSHDLAPGDVITSTPTPVTVRTVDHGEGARVTVNTGAPDEASGFAWQWVTVDRSST
ncbi:hypothetical protein [Streptomyces purpureus]|uniref:Uncharacterized protein n=1 Tax=Streptomyces purpureus TaxID=1951 RepID=A0A918LSG0_9ACTN|nr:hypothetical protein [Streptomyces purpureus]GGT43513.1 hypothetical protein GCM10014713_41540 [Streptomyces purpureus]